MTATPPPAPDRSVNPEIAGDVPAAFEMLPDTRPRCGGTPGKPGVTLVYEGGDRMFRSATTCKGCADCAQPAKSADWLVDQIERANQSIEKGPDWVRVAAASDYSARVNQPAPTPSGDEARAAFSEKMWGLGPTDEVEAEAISEFEAAIRAESLRALQEARERNEWWKGVALDDARKLGAAEERLREVEGELDRLRAREIQVFNLMNEWLKMTWEPYAHPGILLRNVLVAPAATPSTDEEGRV